MTYRGQKEALAEFLPLNAQNWITCGNALRLDWLSVCPPTGTGVKFQAEDLFMSPLEQAQIDFENEGGETYICGNPPYLGSKRQNKEQKEDLGRIFDGRTKSWKSLDYVAGWFMKAADYGLHTPCVSAFVSTNSICQGQQVPILWPLIFETGHEIPFAHTSFKWANLASHNAGVTVAIIAISNHVGAVRNLYALNDAGETVIKAANNINAYLVAAPDIIIESQQVQISKLPEVYRGNSPTDGGHLILSADEVERVIPDRVSQGKFVKPFVGSIEIINGTKRYCIWI